MKQLLPLILLMLFFNYHHAQLSSLSERTIEIAILEGNSAKPITYPISDLNIESKISWILKLNKQDIKLVNPKLLNEPGKGWSLQFEFSTPIYAGIYKEKLRLISNKLAVTENRTAVMAMASNCNAIVFSNSEDRCKCIDKKDVSLDAELTYRLFSSVH